LREGNYLFGVDKQFLTALIFVIHLLTPCPHVADPQKPLSMSGVWSPPSDDFGKE
jgi:hypothetical protein